MRSVSTDRLDAHAADVVEFVRSKRGKKWSKVPLLLALIVVWLGAFLRADSKLPLWVVLAIAVLTVVLIRLGYVAYAAFRRKQAAKESPESLSTSFVYLDDRTNDEVRPQAGALIIMSGLLSFVSRDTSHSIRIHSSDVLQAVHVPDLDSVVVNTGVLDLLLDDDRTLLFWLIEPREDLNGVLREADFNLVTIDGSRL